MKKRATRIIIQFFIVIFLLEVVLRLAYFQTKGNDPFAIVSAYKKITFSRPHIDHTEKLLMYQQRIRPDSANVNKQIVAELMRSNAFEYTPWVDYRISDFRGKYVNTNGFNRKTVPANFINDKKPEPLKIFLFGGSTMFGFNVIDSETIPSALTKIYAEKCSDCPSIQVYNFGIPAYYSYPELMLISHLIYTGNKPDIAIFLDGINEFVLVQAAKNRWPWYFYRLKAGSAEDSAAVNDSTQSLFAMRTGESVAETGSRLADNYISNILNIQTVCHSNGIRPLFFIQPTAYYSYPNKMNDGVVDTASNKLIEYEYPLLQKKCDSVENLFFLGDMLNAERGMPFVDRIHYSPYMNKRIAEVIFERIVEGK